MFEIKVSIDLRGLEKFRELVHTDTSGPKHEAIRNALLQWAARYRAFVQQRFDLYSKGGGDWKDLAPSTKLARMRRPVARLYEALHRGDVTEEQFEKRIKTARRKVAKEKAKDIAGEAEFTILRDTNTLFEAVDPVFRGQPGALEDWVPYGIRVGFGGSSSYPNGATIADVAEFHQMGNSRLPRREIIVEPPEEVLEAMREDAAQALHILANS